MFNEYIKFFQTFLKFVNFFEKYNRLPVTQLF